MCRSQAFGDYQIELLTERLFGAVTEQRRGGTVPAPDRSCGIFKDRGIGDLFEDCFSQRKRVFHSLLLSGWTVHPPTPVITTPP